MKPFVLFRNDVEDIFLQLKTNQKITYQCKNRTCIEDYCYTL